MSHFLLDRIRLSLVFRCFLLLLVCSSRVAFFSWVSLYFALVFSSSISHWSVFDWMCAGAREERQKRESISIEPIQWQFHCDRIRFIWLGLGEAHVVCFCWSCVCSSRFTILTFDKTLSVHVLFRGRDYSTLTVIALVGWAKRRWKIHSLAGNTKDIQRQISCSVLTENETKIFK